jgi:hypothetical protein
MVRLFFFMMIMGVMSSLFYVGCHKKWNNEMNVRQPRADIVRVDDENRMEKRERPDVLFLHDLHSKALAGDGAKGCMECHLLKDGKFTPLFVAEGLDKEKRMTAYHERCSGCHTRMAQTGKTSGPLTCSGCHAVEPRAEQRVEPVRFDKSLHQEHIDATEKSCNVCHHRYNSETKRLEYKKGSEQSCVYCHPESGNGKDLSLKQASHLQCIVCHENRKETGEKAGPVLCEGCHAPETRKAPSKVVKIERLNMGQKDFYVMTDRTGGKKVENRGGMVFVPFDHKAHEVKNDSCRVCHHKGLSSCTACHTSDGSEKGGFISLEKAMHDVKSGRSCQGCHEAVMKSADCSGCHSQEGVWIRDGRKECAQCHVIPPARKEGKGYAAEIFREKKSDVLKIDLAGIPDRIVIDSLENKYEPVAFPHRKIVKALSAKINASGLARYFHNGKEALCMGCHHNGPMMDKPMACGSCHEKGKKKRDKNPGLYGAYHIQCMECHKNMNIRQPENCTACHRKKQ